MKRFLIVRLSALGDVVTASPVARVIKEALPDAEVVWAVEERCAAAVLGNPYVDEVLVLPSSRQWRRWLAAGQFPQAAAALRALLDRLRGRRFDAAIDLQGLFKSALLTALARADRKLMPADATERLPFLFTDLVPRRVDPRHISSMYVSMLERLGIRPRGRRSYRMLMPVTEAARRRVADWLAAAGLAPGGYVALVPGTTRPQKMWPEAHWPELARRLFADHGLPAVVVGGPAERRLAAVIAAAAETPLHNAAGETNLPETAALLEAAALTVAVDTGPMHMAVAVGCPTISLFGSTGPRLFDDGSRYVCLHRQFACWPCNRHPICQRYECLANIRPSDVARAARAMLAEESPNSPANKVGSCPP